MKNTVLLISILFIFSACIKDSETELVVESEPCVFVQDNDTMDGLIDENERAIMTSCLENRITSEAELRDNMIGSWELIGHGEGWIATRSQPCASMVFSADEVVYSFTNATLDTTFTMFWSTVQDPIDTDVVFVEFENIELPATDVSFFCEQYMFVDATVSDGNMYLYEKVE